MAAEPKVKRYGPDGEILWLEASETSEFEVQRKCMCPDDCNCHYSWRTNYCGCKQHEAVV
jgi:hypothetical protein